MESAESLQVLDRSIPFVDAVFRILEGAGTESEAALILRDAEARNGIRFSTVCRVPEAIHLPDELYEAAEHNIHRFLTETQMVFGGYEYAQLDVMYGDYVGLWSHRSWGALVAGWANQTNWLGKSDWNYLDFYGGLNDRVVRDYLTWSEAMMRVIQVKSCNDVS